ncbi:unnamed protein product [Bursaphelenchus xylophilus]|uniref:(pine wood nematode) hypothetical protein n=1 Tax=Bursaphelenchus xylophilus TaxID=6326 RepID=A0A7I8XEM0_BURXY|nr:unnamed protein product [Bursaphelenchus xylophilus]CAG9113124.1 unnamed protein product [Bursaphelenchus xylophilus]
MESPLSEEESPRKRLQGPATENVFVIVVYLFYALKQQQRFQRGHAKNRPSARDEKEPVMPKNRVNGRPNLPFFTWDRKVAAGYSYVTAVSSVFDANETLRPLSATELPAHVT